MLELTGLVKLLRHCVHQGERSSESFQHHHIPAAQCSPGTMAVQRVGTGVAMLLPCMQMPWLPTGEAVQVQAPFQASAVHLLRGCTATSVQKVSAETELG